MIYRLGPEIRDIPNANNDMMVKSTLAANFLNTLASRKNRLQVKLVNKLIHSQLGKSAKPSPEDFNFAVGQDAPLRDTIETFVHSNGFNRDF